MTLRTRIADEMKASMKAGTAARTSTLRMVASKLKTADIEGRPRTDEIAEDGIVALLRKMVKERQESAVLYRQGNREELASKEEAEILVIEELLPASLDDEALRASVDAAVTELGASSVKDMGKVVAALKAKHGAALDMGKAGPMVKARLVG